MSATEMSIPKPRPAWRQKLSRFWRWWTQELLAVAPQRFGALGGAARLPQLALENGDVILVEPRAAAGGRVEIDAMEPGRQRAAVQALLESAGETRGRARLALIRGESLVRRVTMPAATEENLGAVLGFEMDRLTPFRSDDVYYDYRVVGRDPSAGTIAVLLAVARRDLVDARVERLRSLGVSVQGVTPGDDAAAATAGLDVLPSTQRGERESAAERTLRNGLALAVALLFFAALALPILGKWQAVRALTPQLEKAHAEAQSTDALVQQLERQVGDYNFLLAKKHGTPPVLAYLEEATRLLPDNTWLQQLDIKSGAKARELQISGETPSSSRLIEVLEQSALLKNAAPRGTVTRGSQPGMERFVIAAETQTRPLPEARKVTEIVNLVPPPVTPPAPRAAAPAQPAPPSAAPAAKGSPPPAQTPQTATVEPVAPPRQAGGQRLIFQPRGKQVQPPLPPAPAPQSPPPSRPPGK